VGALAIGFLAGVTVRPVGADGTERVSVASDGTQANDRSGFPALSADGRIVAFESRASNLVPHDTNRDWDVFVHDRHTGVTERVSVASDGTEANGPSTWGSLSADGRIVAFRSRASNLVPGDTNRTYDIFVHDRQTGITERVSVASNGAQANDLSSFLALSADGRVVAFESSATNLVPSDTNGTADVFVHDRQTGVTERVSVASDGTEGNNVSRSPVLSADGRIVAFESLATNLVPGDTNGAYDVFVHDRQTGVTERVSVASDGSQSNNFSGYPALSADGRLVAFYTRAGNLHVAPLAVHDRQTGVTEHVSVPAFYNSPENPDEGFSLSADGRVLAAPSYNSFGPDDTSGSPDVFVHDRQTGMTERVSVDSLGAQGNGGSFSPVLSGDGDVVAFQSRATNLVADDTNGADDIFVRERTPTSPITTSATAPSPAITATQLSPSTTGASGADGACNATCRRDTARCIATQCAGVGRKACRRRCKPAAIRTLAYVLSECRADAAGSVAHQSLRIRRGDREPITVAEFGPFQGGGASGVTGFCRSRLGGFSDVGWGDPSVFGFPLQRLGVSPDGSGVVFEVNDEFSVSGLTVAPEQRGMFFVRSDGKSVPRYLGAPSHERSFVPTFAISPLMAFSPNGRRIAFTDRGPGPGGEEAPQIVVLDLETGRRTLVTRLPSGTAPVGHFGEFLLTCCPTFIDNETVLFQTFVDPDGSNSEHTAATFTVRIDGTNLQRVPPPIVLPGSAVVPSFGVIGRRTNLVRVAVPGTPVSPPTTPPQDFPLTEAFLQDSKNLIQLTNFRRTDTFTGFLNPTRRRAFFVASADPLGTNPFEECQIFSVDTVGGGLRQVTHFDPRTRNRAVIPACFGADRPHCSIGAGYYRVVVQDPVTKAVVFESSCDPFDTNPNGGQIFAMRPDGGGLRQLTEAAGITHYPDGSIRVELPGPFAYSAVPR